MRSLASQGPGECLRFLSAVDPLGNAPRGILSNTAAVAMVESEGTWEAHRAGIVRDLGAEGTLEVVLAERVALLLWRLARVSRYEREMLAIRQETAEDDLAQRRKHEPQRREPTPTHPEDVRAEVDYQQRCLRLLRRFSRLEETAPLSGADADIILYAIARSADVDLSELQLPYVGLDDVIEEVPGWTAGRIRACVATIAAVNPDDPAELLEIAASYAERQLNRARHEMKTVERELHRMRRERLLGDSVLLERIHRQEACLSRELAGALRELQDLQGRRVRTTLQPTHWAIGRLYACVETP